MSPVRKRVEADVKAGRLWKARDRLIGLLRAKPADQWGLTQLGHVYFRMGDLPQAGRAWFLSGRTGPEWESAESAFYERYGRKASQVVPALRVRAAIDRFPPGVQERLRDLQRELAGEGRVWEPRDHEAPPSRSGIRDRLGAAAAALIVAIILVALGVGLFNMALYLIHVFSQ
jgi:hypothetical protein